MRVLNPKTINESSALRKARVISTPRKAGPCWRMARFLTADVQNAPNSEIYNATAKKRSGRPLAAPSSICTLRRLSVAYSTVHKASFAITRLERSARRSFDQMAQYSSPAPTRAPGAAPGHTAVYDSVAGGWTVGPDFPNGDNAGDSFAVLLTNGNVLVEGDSGEGYIFNGTTLTASASTPGSLMILPNGQVLVGGGTTEVYTSSGTYQSSWQPTISSFPSTVTHGSTYEISGTQFNGLSQAASFGDEFQTATNYPLVQITNSSTHHVFYARTHDHSTMGVATGAATVSTNFDVPTTIETGASTLVVIANGIPSQPVSITVQ